MPELQRQSNGPRYAVVVTRFDFDEAGFALDQVVLGPFRRRARAEARAETVRRLAAKYDEPKGTLTAVVEPIRTGSLSAQDAMDYLYGSIVDG